MKIPDQATIQRVPNGPGSRNVTIYYPLIQREIPRYCSPSGGCGGKAN
jgi:hypothetical protein